MLRSLLLDQMIVDTPISMISRLDHEPGSREQVMAVVQMVRGLLKDAVLGVYLFGSAVAGGLRPDSDLDILAVSGRALTSAERAAVIRQLLVISRDAASDGPGRPVEVTALARPDVSPWRYPGRIELQYGEWMRARIERGDVPEWPCPDPDVAILIETARRAAVPLFGPPVATLLDPVPHADLVRAMLDTVSVVVPEIEEGDDRRYGLLTLARVWTTLATGEIRSKDEAADWALARLPEEHRPVLARARAAHLGEGPDDWADLVPRLRPLVDHVVAQVRALTAGSPSIS
jgi:streptomycin 3"-adenylyltransferase